LKAFNKVGKAYISEFFAIEAYLYFILAIENHELIQLAHTMQLYCEGLSNLMGVHYFPFNTNKRLNRFSLRGKTKVNAQWLMFCMVHNIEKYQHYGSIH